MEINQINKKLYELAFIQNGEYGYHEESTWKPSINEREIHEWEDPGDGSGYKVATPLGFREYSKSRLQGIQNILDQYPCVDLSNDDKLHNIRKQSNIIRQYDKIKITEKVNGVECDAFYVVTGDDKEKFFVINAEGKEYYVNYLNEDGNKL